MQEHNRFYRLPLALVSSGLWAQIGSSGRTILPVLGLHANKYMGTCYPSIETIRTMSGCGSNSTVERGLKRLIDAKLLLKERRSYSSNTYELINEARWKRQTFYQFKERGIMRYWGNLLPCEKTTYIVLAVKATILELDEFLPYVKIHKGTRGKYRKLAGLTSRSWKKGFEGLEEKELIALNGSICTISEVNEEVTPRTPAKILRTPEEQASIARKVQAMIEEGVKNWSRPEFQNAAQAYSNN